MMSNHNSVFKYSNWNSVCTYYHSILLLIASGTGQGENLIYMDTVFYYLHCMCIQLRNISGNHEKKNQVVFINIKEGAVIQLTNISVFVILYELRKLKISSNYCHLKEKHIYSILDSFTGFITFFPIHFPFFV